MKNIIFILVVILIVLITSSCSDTKNDKAQATLSKQIEKIALPLEVMTEIVEIEAEATVTEDKRIIVKGTTNLPNSTDLFITVNNEKIDFRVTYQTSVSNNHFSTSPLGESTGLLDGNYTIEILMPTPSVQPKTVQAIIGEEGEHLSGPLVDDEWDIRVAKKIMTYSIGLPESIAKNENQHQDLVGGIMQETVKLLVLGQEMENIRNTKNLDKLRLCANQMRENHSAAKNLRQQSEELSHTYRNLKLAIMEVYSCVSCSSDALEACERVKKLL